MENEDITSEAIKLIEFIAYDYYELSYQKIELQRNEYKKRCRKFLDTYVNVNIIDPKEKCHWEIDLGI